MFIKYVIFFSFFLENFNGTDIKSFCQVQEESNSELFSFSAVQMLLVTCVRLYWVDLFFESCIGGHKAGIQVLNG
jgi:hypothetical protein